jgi:signal peptidase I
VLRPRTGALRDSLIVCSQLSTSFRFNNSVPDANTHFTFVDWLRVLTIGRRPKATLVRIVVLVVTCFITFKFILLPIRIEGISMEPTYHNGAVNFINRLAYFRHEPQRGDIVSVRLAGNHVMFMKRIIGLPGETLAFHEGHAFINGQRLDEPYIKNDCDWETGPIQCSTNEFYVVGDNREMPFDLHKQGRAKRERIVGKLLL